MQIHNLANNAAQSGYNRVVILTHEDLTEATANTAQTIPLFAVRPGSIVRRVDCKLIRPFKDASDAAFNSNTVTVGDGGSANRFLASQQLNKNGTEIDYPVGTGTVYQYTAADTVDAVIGSMSAKSLSDIDTGELHLYFNVIDMDQLGEPIAVS